MFLQAETINESAKHMRESHGAPSIPFDSESKDLKECLVLFDESARLARSGFYEDAEGLIRQALRYHTELNGLLWDLLAKVYAQQGRFLDAEGCWRKALKCSPDDATYQAAIRYICHQRRTSVTTSVVQVLIGLFGIAVAAYAGASIFIALNGQ